MTLEEWARAAMPATTASLRRPPPVLLYPHQAFGARRLLDLLARFGGALLFDGVGMGKSFTAAAVAREWRGRGPVAVSVPAPLVGPWRATLARFGVDAEVVSHDRLASFPACATGSLLVVDEAHRFRNAGTWRYRILAERAGRAALVLVTATPLCNRLDDVRTLVRLAFADDALKEFGVPSLDFVFDAARPADVRSVLACLGVRRERADGVRFPSAERRVVRFTLGAAGERIARAIEALDAPLCGESAGPALVRSHLRARLESSPDALRDSLERQRRFYRRAREKLGEGFVLTRRDFASLFEREERELFQELLFPEAFLSKADPDASLRLAIGRELKRIDSLLVLLRECAPDKFERLAGVLADRQLLPAIVFTRAVATAARVAETFRAALRVGSASSRGAVDDRGVEVPFGDLVRSFRSRAMDLLVLTDLASEGLDLQAAASVVHFDLPWTAVKLDQRNGRAIRIGQVRTSVRSIYFVPAAGRERTPLRFVARKERLANRYLQADPFDPGEEAGSAGSVRIARVSGRTVIADGGSVFLENGGTLSADPRALRAMAHHEVEPFEGGPTWWAEWKATARLIPSRIDRGSAAARIAFAMGSDLRDDLQQRLAARYRAGIELRLAGLAGNGSALREQVDDALEGPGAVSARSGGAAENPASVWRPTPGNEPAFHPGE
ncbi:MAG TPA: helicase-related protein [Thermoanaerobaculia bacterium]